jgi:hypothetical protein
LAPVIGGLADQGFKITKVTHQGASRLGVEWVGPEPKRDIFINLVKPEPNYLVNFSSLKKPEPNPEKIRPDPPPFGRSPEL